MDSCHLHHLLEHPWSVYHTLSVIPADTLR
jgi:hypothetical protein